MVSSSTAQTGESFTNSSVEYFLIDNNNDNNNTGGSTTANNTREEIGSIHNAESTRDTRRMGQLLRLGRHYGMGKCLYGRSIGSVLSSQTYHSSWNTTFLLLYLFMANGMDVIVFLSILCLFLCRNGGMQC
jgi:hypothetical protein